MTPEDFYDTTPKPAMLRGMQSQPWTVAGALSELVDNSFGPGRGDARKCHITYDTKAKTFTVLDNGRGMEAIGRLYQLGTSPVRVPGDIGNYGYGGSYAILWLARRVEIWTLVNNKVQSDAINWAEVMGAPTFPLVSNRWEDATIRNTPAELLDEGHGTLIRVHLPRERKVSVSNVQRDLAATYAPAARLGRELVWTTLGKNGETRNLGDAVIAFPDPQKVVTFNLIVHTQNADLPVEGMVGVVDGLPFEKSVISIGFGPRVIVKTKDCFVSPDKEERFSGSGVTGWLDLADGWQPFLTTTKDGMNDQPVWESLMGFVYQKIRPLLESVETTKLELELEGIALNVERQLGGLCRVEVAGRERRQASTRDPNGVGHTATGDGEPRNPRNLDPTDSDGDGAEAPSAAARILIVPQTDEQMEKQLVTATEVSDGIQVAINKDHPVIKEALRQRPVNKMMLNLGITREIASVIDASTSLRTKLFTAAQQRDLDAIEGDGKTVRLIHRWLMDSVKDKAA